MVGPRIQIARQEGVTLTSIGVIRAHGAGPPLSALQVLKMPPTTKVSAMNATNAFELRNRSPRPIAIKTKKTSAIATFITLNICKSPLCSTWLFFGKVEYANSDWDSNRRCDRTNANGTLRDNWIWSMRDASRATYLSEIVQSIL